MLGKHELKALVVAPFANNILSMRKRESKICVQCGVIFHKAPKLTHERYTVKKFCSDICCRKFRKGKSNLKNKGEKNGMWKGDKVGYLALHDYIKHYLTKPKNCQDCNKIKILDLANISGKYKRDFDDWEWLCRKCHMRKDGRAERLRFTGHRHTLAERKKMSISLKKAWVRRKSQKCKMV